MVSRSIPLRLTWPFLFWFARDSRTKSLSDGFHAREQSFSECGDSVSGTTNCGAHTISGAFSHRCDSSRHTGCKSSGITPKTLPNALANLNGTAGYSTENLTNTLTRSFQNYRGKTQIFSSTKTSDGTRKWELNWTYLSQHPNPIQSVLRQHHDRHQ